MLIITLLILIIIFFLIYGFAENYFPVTEEYEIFSDKINRSATFVLLTDLHGCRHGRENGKLLEMIRKVSPDFVCVAGDMTVKNGKHTEEVLALMNKMAGEYAVYYSPGNHEIRMPEYESYRKELREAGVHYLENQSAEIGDGIWIAGLDMDEYWYHKFWQKRVLTEEELTEYLGKCPADRFSVLLAHNPEYFLRYAGWGADLTLSGHIHGGIAGLPVLGGVISPSLRLFPKYDAGIFERGGHRMIVSRGLGLHHIKLRFFNRPELSVIKLTCQPGGK